MTYIRLSEIILTSRRNGVTHRVRRSNQYLIMIIIYNTRQIYAPDGLDCFHAYIISKYCYSVKHFYLIIILKKSCITF
ncbi:hypothetical protein [Salmonella phage PHA46]